MRAQQRPKEYFAPHALAESELLGVVASVQAAPGPGPSPPGLQAPIRSVVATLRTGQWEGPGGWQEALEDEIERAFIEFRSTRAVSARGRREPIAEHGRGKAQTLRLAAPFKEKRNANGAVAMKKAKATARDLVGDVKTPDTFSENPAGKTSRYMTQLELQNPGVRKVHKDAGGTYFHGKQPDIKTPSGRAIFAPIPLGWAGLGAKHGLCFDEHQRGGPTVPQVAGYAPGLQYAGVIWAENFTDFLLGFRFARSIVDRRLFYHHYKPGLLLMVGTFVND